MSKKSLWSSFIFLIVSIGGMACAFLYIGEFIARAEGVEMYKPLAVSILMGVYNGFIGLIVRMGIEVSPVRETRLNLPALYLFIANIISVVIATFWIYNRFPTSIDPLKILIPLWWWLGGTCIVVCAYFIIRRHIKGMKKEEVFT